MYFPVKIMTVKLAIINHGKKNKDNENKNKMESKEDGSEIPEEAIEEELDEEPYETIGEKQDREFPEKHVSSKIVLSVLYRHE